MKSSNVIVTFAAMLAAGLSPVALAQFSGSEFVIKTVVGSDPVRDGGPAKSALLVWPESVALDKAGNIYIADTGNYRLRKVGLDNVITTAAGTGVSGSCCLLGDNNPATETRVGDLRGLGIDESGSIYVADSEAHQILKVSSGGMISAVAGGGSMGFSGDGGPATRAELAFPYDVAVDSTGNIYVADTGNQRIRKVTPEGIISTVAGTGGWGSGGDGGSATAAQLGMPTGVAVDGAGNIYIADYRNQRIRRVTPDGIIGTVAGTGAPGFGGDGGPATSAALNYPQHLALDRDGNLYIADVYNYRIRKVTPDGMISTVAGTGVSGFGGDGGPATAAQLGFAKDVAVDGTGNIYIADNGNHRIRKVTPEGVISTAVGTSHLIGDGGLATEAVLFHPIDATTDNAGNWYVADGSNNVVRRITPDGVISTLAGTGQYGFSGDGGPATSAELALPSDVALDSIGNIYIADSGNLRIRKVTPDGIIRTVAGKGVLGFGGDGGPATSARFNLPFRVETDLQGNLYIADRDNHRIRRVGPDGLIVTVAGSGPTGASNGGFGGDGGPAIQARLDKPDSVAVDDAGNIYISDKDNHRIRRVSPDGIISTVAGNGLDFGSSGDGGPATEARLAFPRDIEVDAAGNLYVIESSAVRRITSDGIITTVAGTGELGFSGDAGPADAARLCWPLGLATDDAGHILIADTENNRIRLLTPVPVISSGGILNGASFLGGPYAPALIVSLFGSNLATATEQATSVPLPASLAGTTVTVKDTTGTEHPGLLFFVSPTQINLLIPAQTAIGPATLIVTTAEGYSSSAAIQVEAVAPGLFAANSNGQGVAAALALRVGSDGSQSTIFVFQLDALQGRFVPLPIDLSPEMEQVYLLLFGTGWRGFTSQVTATVGGESVPVLGAGPQGQFVGLDQINIGPLPRSLAGRGEVNIVLTVDAKQANTVTVGIQ